MYFVNGEGYTPQHVHILWALSLEKTQQGDCESPFCSQVQEWINPSKHFSEDDIMYTALKWAIAVKVILSKEISTRVKCFQKNTKEWASWGWLAVDGWWWWWFFEISCTCRKERLPNECSVVKRVKTLSQKARKQRRKLLYMYMCVWK